MSNTTFTDIWRAAVRAAVRAPSIHNSQPWRFVADGDLLHVLADPARRLPGIDPTGREWHVSCGAALLHIELAVRVAAGRETVIELLPDPADVTHLATVRLARRRPPSSDERLLFAAIPRRRSNRQPFTTQQVPTSLLRQWRREIGRYGAWLHPLDDEAARRAIVQLTSDAEAAQRADPGYARELAAWTGEDSSEGVPQRAWRTTAEASEVPVRDFEASPTAGGRPELAQAERLQLLVIGTDRDEPADWLRAGMATEWLWLTLCVHALDASPMTQALDWPEYRGRVAPLLGLSGHPQMMLRIGQRSTNVERAPRRRIDDVFTIR